MIDLARMIDHTLLRPDATKEDVEKLCREAVAHNFYAVCVNPCRVKDAKSFLDSSRVKVATVSGFPLGATTAFAKYQETQKALGEGADEIDMVMNIGKLVEGDLEAVGYEIQLLRRCGGFVLKAIAETCLLSDEQKKTACLIAMDSGADYIKTSTGFSTGGATVSDVKLFKAVAGDRIKIKASGGIRDREFALRLAEAGADRLGCSRSVDIIRG